jgi:phospholipid/cholesterol/gamma-HCH transport system ATP-binding protein
MGMTLPATATATATPIVELRDVGLALGDNVLLEGANLALYPGETLAIIGESGCGKSVMLKMFIGLLKPDTGTVFFKGQNLAELDQPALDQIRRQVGYVFQNDALFDSMTNLENIGYSLREHANASDEEIRVRALECLHMVGLEERVLELHPSGVSGGMRKRVGVARAIAAKPEVLLYDEPTQGLDPQNITRIGELITKLQRELNATSVVVTHDMRTAFGVADRIALMHDRHFPHVGTPRELLHSTDEPVREFIEDAMDELVDLPSLAQASTTLVPA